MKKFLLSFSIILIIATVMVACNSKDSTPAATQQIQTTIDTTGLAQFNSWKAQHELATMQQYEQSLQSTQTTTAKKPATQKVVYVPVRKAPVKRSVATTKSTSTSSSSNEGTMTGNEGTTASTEGSANSQSSNEAKVEEKKGMSKAVKGAIIGGVTGGVTGAIINKKNRVVGGVVGAVIGAGGGYVIGKQMDKKDGRIEL